ncbi:MAG: RNA methyltransferase [Planctomycetes bacterium]|nr:RNA methyltransferase [Planctomycetota bacterium]
MIPRATLLSAKRLASRANPRIKEWAGLDDRDRREAGGLTLAEGARLVAEGLRVKAGSPFQPAALLVSDAGAGRPEAGDCFTRAEALGVARFSLSDDCFRKISPRKGSDGLALVMTTDYQSADLAVLDRPDARWLVAAGIQDPGNAGALARTALAAGWFGCLYLDSTDPRSPKFLRGSMGAAFHLPCISATTEEFLDHCRHRHVRLLVASADPRFPDYRRADYQPPLALVVGGERGVPDTVAALATAQAHIPLDGGVESLNLAVAAGILLFEARRHPEGRVAPGTTA